MHLFASIGSRRMSWPPTVTVPSVGARQPVMIFMVSYFDQGCSSPYYSITKQILMYNCDGFMTGGVFLMKKHKNIRPKCERYVICAKNLLLFSIICGNITLVSISEYRNQYTQRMSIIVLPLQKAGFMVSLWNWFISTKWVPGMLLPM